MKVGGKTWSGWVLGTWEEEGRRRRRGRNESWVCEVGRRRCLGTWVADAMKRREGGRLKILLVGVAFGVW